MKSALLSMPAIAETLRQLEVDMLQFRRELKAEGEFVWYWPWHVRRCIRILKSHVRAVERARDAARADGLVRRTCKRLHRLNLLSFGWLLETMEREMICDVMIRAGAEMGFNEPDEDVTEEYRDW